MSSTRRFLWEPGSTLVGPPGPNPNKPRPPPVGEKPLDDLDSEESPPEREDQEPLGPEDATWGFEEDLEEDPSDWLDGVPDDPPAVLEDLPLEVDPTPLSSFDAIEDDPSSTDFGESEPEADRTNGDFESVDELPVLSWTPELHVQGRTVPCRIEHQPRTQWVGAPFLGEQTVLLHVEGIAVTTVVEGLPGNPELLLLATDSLAGRFLLRL